LGEFSPTGLLFNLGSFSEVSQDCIFFQTNFYKQMCWDVLAAGVVVTTPPATGEIKAIGREIESRHGIWW
jgi:hypothetical protein